MLKQELIFRNPLRLMGHETQDILPPGAFGAVLARAGLGKTSILVQLALDSLLRDKPVLHISLTDPVKKVCLWYEEVFRNIGNMPEETAGSGAAPQMDQLWETILPKRLIMTFNVEGFSVPKLEERLTDLTEQDIFHPQVLLLDGLPFDEMVRNSLTELKSLAESQSFSVWFTVRTHRDGELDPHGLPLSFSEVSDLFQVAFQLQPEEKEIRLNLIKGGDSVSEHPPLLLDPSTMLIKDTGTAD